MDRPRTSLIAIAAIVGLIVVGYAGGRWAVEWASPRPSDPRVSNGQLAPCPESSNCVTSRATDASQATVPIVYSTSTEAARNRLINILNSIPRLTIVEDRPDYIRAETRSLVWGFIDDNEFYFDESIKVIEVRAASRLNIGDSDRNRERIEMIRTQFETAEQ
jgi:uncharacterized protein (DUF1499 family)